MKLAFFGSLMRMAFGSPKTQVILRTRPSAFKKSDLERPDKFCSASQSFFSGCRNTLAQLSLVFI